MYHITITDIKTGEVAIDQDTDALIASVRVENGVRGMTLLDAHAIDVACVVDAATRTTARVLHENPRVERALWALLAAGDVPTATEAATEADNG